MSETQSSTDRVIIERILEAPIDTVWSMWTKPEHFQAWYGPDGASISVAEMDVRQGGRRLVGMTMETPDGIMQMWFVGEYLDVVPPSRLAYTESMADEAGNVLSPSDLGMPDGHPETTEVNVELESLGERTKMVLTHIGVDADSGGAGGWAMALDELARYLERSG